MESSKRIKSEKIVYKCPFLNCNVESSKATYVDEHIELTKHEKMDFVLKCPIVECKNQKDCPLHFTKKNAKLLRLIKYQEHVIESFNCGYKDLMLKDILNSRDTIAIIIKKFIKQGQIKTYDDKKVIHCKVFGCNKEYKAFQGYLYHIWTYKHPISEIVAEYSRLFKIEIDDVKLKAELMDEKYVNGFNICGVKHYSGEGSFVEKPISFKNDFFTADPKKDKFIYKKNIQHSDLSYIKQYEAVLTDNTVIHSLIYKGEKFEKKHGNLAFALSYHNMNEFISCAYFDKKNKCILVSTRSSKDQEILFSFQSYPSRISVLDLNLNLTKTVNFDYGSALKIRSSEDDFYYILFKDGKIRKINLDNDINHEIIGENYIDFEVYDDSVLLCTNGLKIIKIKNNEIIAQSDYFPQAVNYISIKTIQHSNEHKNLFLEKRISLSGDQKATKNKEEKLYIINEEENKMLEEIREKLKTYRIFCNTVEGNLYALNEDLTDCFDIVNTFSHKVEYLEAFDFFIIMDPLYEKTKVLTIDKEFIKTHLLHENISYCSNTALGTIISSGYNGVIYQTWFNYHRLKNIQLIQFYRSGSNLLVLDHIDEYNLLPPRKEYDYSTLPICLFENEHYIYIFLASGVILKKIIKS